MKKALKAFAGLTLANLIAFAAIAGYLGGDALNGWTEGGRYYLAIRGRPTEVTEGVYFYSKVHAISLIVMVAVVLLGAFLTRPSREERGSPTRS